MQTAQVKLSVPHQQVFQDNFNYLSSQIVGHQVDLNEEIGYLNQIVFNSLATTSPLDVAASWSVYRLLLNVCRLGLSLDPEKKLAYVIPSLTETGEKIMKLYPGYRGEIAIASNANVLKNANAVLVYENDHFRIQAATGEIEHFVTSLSIDPRVRGACSGGYCRSVLMDGSVLMSYLSIEEMDSIAQHQIEANMGNTPWNSIWRTEMNRVALYRRAAKDWRQLIKATPEMQSSLLDTEF
ncbi:MULTISPECIES: recombinase RecT [unclassified Shewanella]|uniref:recombinase RecT n=1 Tax=Shewanella TaxID=22 RepID=UPI0021D8E974|nr:MULTISPECIES: recombinase RecT [unclassified Shewanella]MCU7962098.1 recombinase RecT [Shewanella sp. SW32]MCU7970030.1 recombinase RecT [Shewanella sp. SW29]MCU8013786.1 recombinase RecT [Shewanella sp. SM74]MCU8056178.1 recombinase RecT [Shewanella sp. SM35]MCU8065112.1 recombinase RecT [Shewanella sp. SM34]